MQPQQPLVRVSKAAPFEFSGAFGRGGYSVVTKTHHLCDDDTAAHGGAAPRGYALKWARQTSHARNGTEFWREVQTSKEFAARAHAGAPCVFAAVEADDAGWLVDGARFSSVLAMPRMAMDLHTLQRDLEVHEHGMPFGMWASIMLQLADGARVLHEEGICHRDIKRGNVLVEFNRVFVEELTRGREWILDREDEGGTRLRDGGAVMPLLVQLADFGLAKRTAAGDDDLRPAKRRRDDDLTSTEVTTVNMRAYAVQLADGMRYNETHDMFSLGVVASELCTGRHLFYGYLGPEPRLGYSNFACIFEHLRIPQLTPDDEADPMLARHFMDESAEPSHAPGERWHVYNVYRFGWPMYEEELVDHALAAKLSTRLRLNVPTYAPKPKRVLAALLRRHGFPNQKWPSALHALASLLDAMGLVVRAGVVFSLGGGGDLVAALQRHMARFAEIVTFCERVDACDRAPDVFLDAPPDYVRAQHHYVRLTGRPDDDTRPCVLLMPTAVPQKINLPRIAALHRRDDDFRTRASRPYGTPDSHCTAARPALPSHLADHFDLGADWREWTDEQDACAWRVMSRALCRNDAKRLDAPGLIEEVVAGI